MTGTTKLDDPRSCWVTRTRSLRAREATCLRIACNRSLLMRLLPGRMIRE